MVHSAGNYNGYLHMIACCGDSKSLLAHLVVYRQYSTRYWYLVPRGTWCDNLDSQEQYQCSYMVYPPGTIIHACLLLLLQHDHQSKTAEGSITTGTEPSRVDFDSTCPAGSDKSTARRAIFDHTEHVPVPGVLCNCELITG